MMGHEEAMTAAERTRWICERARAAGFDLCGVAPVDALEELAHLPEWLDRGYAGEMNYLRDPRRADPRRILASARSLIVVALNYNTQRPYSTETPVTTGDEPPRGLISRYAWGDDYHEVLGEKLDTLLAAMRAQFTESFEARAYVDTGPVVERVAAKYAGLGWLAKNTCLELPAVPRYMPHASFPRALCPRRAPLRLLPHHRIARRYSGIVAPWHRERCNRLRHLPGRVPLEPQGAGNANGSISAATILSAG